MDLVLDDLVPPPSMNINAKVHVQSTFLTMPLPSKEARDPGKTCNNLRQIKKCPFPITNSK